MQNSSTAVKYLSLPLSNYSVLDTSYVSRKVTTKSGLYDGGNVEEETFTLSLPLFELTSALNFPINALLTTDVTVTPDTENSKLQKDLFIISLDKNIDINALYLTIGQIIMRSGPVYFIRRDGGNVKTGESSQVDPNEKDLYITESNGSQETVMNSIDEKVTSVEPLRQKRVVTEDASSLPDWLIWQSSNITACADSNTKPGNITMSSIQAKIVIDLTWQDPNKAKSFQV